MGTVARRGSDRREGGRSYFLPLDVTQKEWDSVFKPKAGLKPEAAVSYHRRGGNVFLIERKGQGEMTPVLVRKLTEGDKEFFRRMTETFEKLMPLTYHEAMKGLRGFMKSQNPDNLIAIADLTRLFTENADAFRPSLDRREGGQDGYIGESFFGAENDVYLATGSHGVGAGFFSVKYEELKKDGTTRPSETTAHIKTVLRSEEFKGMGVPDLLLSQWTKDIDESGRHVDTVWAMIRADNESSASMMDRWGLRWWRMRTEDMPEIPASEGGKRNIAYLRGDIGSIREYVRKLDFK